MEESLCAGGQSGTACESGEIEIRLAGLAADIRPPFPIRLPVAGPLSAGEVLERLMQELGTPGLKEDVENHILMYLVDGTNIDYKQQWETQVQPGSVVALVHPRVGG
jgi:hypothetical protein